MTSGRRGQAVDAWSFDEDRSCLTLILADYRTSETMDSLTKTDVENGFKRLRNFVSSATDLAFVSSLEESDPVSGLAWLIHDSPDSIEKVQLIIVSNALMSSMMAELPSNAAGKYLTSYDIWDFGRLYRTEMSGKTREDVEISFEHLDGGGLPCLPAYTGNDIMKSYLMVMPGKILAELYDQHGERLLEQNVRTFLQFRGKINKGIRNTIINEPHMFFSYNNGISATAEDVSSNYDDTIIQKVRNLQIVNGGQTTASIFSAQKKEKANLDKIYVQIKLSVISPDIVEEVVPKISEYSNTQNKVNAPDFFSNTPFHLRVEELSRRLWAPAPEGSIQQTHWFYERARGQYANQQANLTQSEKKQFLAKNPRHQMFTKTDLAKFILTFEQKPYVVCLGGVKAFSGTPQIQGLAGRVATLWNKSEGSDFNEVWFKQAIAKAIFFRETDRIVFKSSWYASGYKAQVVTYTLAKFANMIERSKLDMDFLGIWNKQCLPETLINQLSIIAESVNEVVRNPTTGMPSNVTEWAKKKACWDIVEKLDLCLNENVRQLLIDREQSRELEHDGRRSQAVDDGINAELYVFNKGAEYWKNLREWNRTAKGLDTKEVSILNIACSIPRKWPTEKQAKVMMDAEKRAIEEGFSLG